VVVIVYFTFQNHPTLDFGGKAKQQQNNNNNNQKPTLNLSTVWSQPTTDNQEF